MPGKQGQVMWPRLVANKILRRTLGSNNFVADFPSNQDTNNSVVDTYDQPSLLHTNKSHNKYKVFVSSWNVGGVAPNDDLDMEYWLDTPKSNPPFDIYVLGFQEVVPLKAGNVLGSENSKICAKWNSLIREALNNKDKKKKKKKRQYYDKDGEQIDDDDDDDDVGPQDFRCIISKQMVGILITVWIRSNLIPFIRSPSVSCVGCGIMGCLGNKGSVSVRFHLHETSLCFVCTHLASGGKEGDEKYRNSNAIEILSRTSFPRGSSLDLPRKILDHDRVILLGDLNYRISLPEATTRSLVDTRDWNVLLQNDQLTTELGDGQVFAGWHESKITFAPTYKYIPNSDAYYGCFQSKKSEKRRSPAWCDRIIWYGKGVKQQVYNRGESKLSDHRPVKAIFIVEVEVSRTLRGLQGFFLSERFERIKDQIDLHKLSSEDDLGCNNNKARSSFQV